MADAASLRDTTAENRHRGSRAPDALRVVGAQLHLPAVTAIAVAVQLLRNVVVEFRAARVPAELLELVDMQPEGELVAVRVEVDAVAALDQLEVAVERDQAAPGGEQRRGAREDQVPHAPAC